MKGRRLFSNIDELMMILEAETDSAPFIQYEVAEERRKEARRMREARFDFVHRGKMFPGTLDTPLQGCVATLKYVARSG